MIGGANVTFAVRALLGRLHEADHYQALYVQVYGAQVVLSGH